MCASISNENVKCMQVRSLRADVKDFRPGNIVSVDVDAVLATPYFEYTNQRILFLETQ